jgi:CRISPR-associated protein Csc3
MTQDEDEYTLADEGWGSEDPQAEPTPVEEKLAIAHEPMLVQLLRNEIRQQWGEDDAVMMQFVDGVLPNMSQRLVTVSAKGGEFAQAHRAQGKASVERYQWDQTMRAHLLNGLLPTLHIAKTMQRWKIPRLRHYSEVTRRLLIAGYTLHDFLKLPEVEEQLKAAGFSAEKAIGAAQIPVLQKILREWAENLGLDRFLQTIGGFELFLDDLLYIVCNTQVRWGTLPNLSLLPQLKLSPDARLLATDLSRLSDILAYVVKSPQTAPQQNKLLAELSMGEVSFTYHHLSENRGVLTNFIHNAVQKGTSQRTAQKLPSDFPDTPGMANEWRVPILFATNGVVYLEHAQQAPAFATIEQYANLTVLLLKTRIGEKLQSGKAGFQRDGKGMKFAEYLRLFFDLPDLLLIGKKATFRIVREGKEPSAGKRFRKMLEGGWMPATVDLDLPDDLRVDQLAECCYLAEKITKESLPNFDVSAVLLEQMGLQALKPTFDGVPRDNRAGGVGYHWYFAAGNFVKANPGLDPQSVVETAEKWLTALAEQVRPLLAQVPPPKDWQILSEYIQRVLTLPNRTKLFDIRTQTLAELGKYHTAKKSGQGTTHTCALCSTAFEVTEQREAAVLFAPQVYSNKRSLNNAKGVRDICPICSLDVMARQILMSRSTASGGDFEGRRLRYLAFYPVYFFTPETLAIVGMVNDQLRDLKLTELHRQLVQKGQVDFSVATLQCLQAFLLAQPDVEKDRYFRQHGEQDLFNLIGIPPAGRDATDAEAWVQPALLSVLLPLCIDVKITLSESAAPLFADAHDFNESVFLDAPHAAIKYLLNPKSFNADGTFHSQTMGGTRLLLEHLLPSAQRLLAAYFIHADANASAGAGGFDYRWHEIPATARLLAQSPLYVFYLLKKWQRKEKSESLPPFKIAEYLQYYHFFGGNSDPMNNHAKTLAELYFQFYRAKNSSSHSILQPLQKSARAILEADPDLFGSPEALTSAVYGSLASFMERAYKEKLAYPPKGSNRESQHAAMQEFSRYLVVEIFYGVFQADKSALRGKQLNLLKNACEVLYLDLWNQSRANSADPTAEDEAAD